MSDRVEHRGQPPDDEAGSSSGANGERRRPLTGRRALDRRVMAVVEGMSDAFLALDAQWRVLYANREAARLNETTPEALVGVNHWEQWPETVGSEVERQYRRAVREHVPVQFEHHYEADDIWHDVRAYPSDDDGLAIFYRDITEQKTIDAEHERHARELADAIAAAEAANVAKSQFLANTSHEIRTPLNAMIGYAELLELELAGPLQPAQRQYLSRMQATSRHLLTIVNDVLDLAKIEAGAMHAVAEPAWVRDVVAAALQLVEPQVRHHGLSLVNACASDLEVAYRGDPERVRQVLVNLLSNAVRFTESDGRVTITCGSAVRAPAEAALAHEGPVTYIRVEDTGVGIASGALESIWDAFVQEDASHTRRYGGSGLGLTISRHLARLMRGEITVRSTPGVGSSFVLWLPAAHASEVRASTAPARLPPATARAAETADQALAAVAQADADRMHVIGDGLLLEIERIVARFAARLRSDAHTPSAHRVTESQAENHMVTLLADLAQVVSSAGAHGPDALSSLRDGTEIERLIAQRHGAQRARLGWTLPELGREYQILREELHAAVQRVAGRGAATDVSYALDLLDRLLEQAERESTLALERARTRMPGRPARSPAG